MNEGPYTLEVRCKEKVLAHYAVGDLGEMIEAACQAYEGALLLIRDGGLDGEGPRSLITENGGIIGPLPGGIVIEVQKVRWSDINPDMDADAVGAEDAEIELATYNAKHSVSR